MLFIQFSTNNIKVPNTNQQSRWTSERGLVDLRWYPPTVWKSGTSGTLHSQQTANSQSASTMYHSSAMYWKTNTNCFCVP